MIGARLLPMSGGSWWDYEFESPLLHRRVFCEPGPSGETSGEPVCPECGCLDVYVYACRPLCLSLAALTKKPHALQVARDTGWCFATVWRRAESARAEPTVGRAGKGYKRPAAE